MLGWFGRWGVQAPTEEHVLEPTQAGSQALGSGLSVPGATQPASQFGHPPVGFPQSPGCSQ